MKPIFPKKCGHRPKRIVINRALIIAACDAALIRRGKNVDNSMRSRIAVDYAAHKK